MKSLIGCKVEKAEINKENNLVVLTTDKGSFYLSFQGDCCAQCYLAHANGVDNLVGSTINDVEQSEWVSDDTEDYSVTETMGVKLTTSKGYVDFETRVEHNGYYGGYILVDQVGPLDQYNSYLYINPLELVTLKDF